MVEKNPKQLQDQSRWVLVIGRGLHSVVSSGGVFWGTRLYETRLSANSVKLEDKLQKQWWSLIKYDQVTVEGILLPRTQRKQGLKPSWMPFYWHKN